ncbi:hypothetical protein GCM10023219_05200 [Stakelama sediminis]
MLHPAKDIVEFRRQPFDFFVGKRDPGKVRDPLHGCFVYGHTSAASTPKRARATAFDTNAPAFPDRIIRFDGCNIRNHGARKLFAGSCVMLHCNMERPDWLGNFCMSLLD